MKTKSGENDPPPNTVKRHVLFSPPPDLSGATGRSPLPFLQGFVFYLLLLTNFLSLLVSCEARAWL